MDDNGSLHKFHHYIYHLCHKNVQKVTNEAFSIFTTFCQTFHWYILIILIKDINFIQIVSVRLLFLYKWLYKGMVDLSWHILVMIKDCFFFYKKIHLNMPVPIHSLNFFKRMEILVPEDLKGFMCDVVCAKSV